MATVVLDLGRIYVNTQLVKKERGVDYLTLVEQDQLYDTIFVKFVKVNIAVDYNLRFSKQVLSDKCQSWEFSPYRVNVTNNINFGLQIKNCLTPFHE